MKVPLSKMQCKIGHPGRRSYETFLRHLRKASHNCGESCANDELIMIFPEKGKIVSLPPGLSQKATGETLNPFLGVPRGRSHLGLREFRKKLFVGETTLHVDHEPAGDGHEMIDGGTCICLYLLPGLCE